MSSESNPLDGFFYLVFCRSPGATETGAVRGETRRRGRLNEHDAKALHWLRPDSISIQGSVSISVEIHSSELVV
jgi:hypothetical protein